MNPRSTHPTRPSGRNRGGAGKQQPATSPGGRSITPLKIGVAIAAVVAVAFWVGQVRGSEELPTSFHGSWVTDDPRYEGRGFALTETTLFLYAQADSSSYPIARIERSNHEGTTIWTVHYEDGDTAVPFQIEAAAGDETRLTFPNQREIVWTRADDRGR